MYFPVRLPFKNVRPGIQVTSLTGTDTTTVIASSMKVADEPRFDAMLELYFPDADTLKAAFGSPVIGALRKDEEALVDLNAPEIRIVAEEHVL